VLDPALPVLLGIHKDGIELAVEPMHVTPCHAFQEAVFSKNADVFGENRMINATCLQVEHLSRKESRQSNRPRRADDDLSEFFPLLRNPAFGESAGNSIFAVSYSGNSEFADGREVFDWDIGKLKVAS
jgi:hypothetical protein